MYIYVYKQKCFVLFLNPNCEIHLYLKLLFKKKHFFFWSLQAWIIKYYCIILFVKFMKVNNSFPKFLTRVVYYVINEIKNLILSTFGLKFKLINMKLYIPFFSCWFWILIPLDRYLTCLKSFSILLVFLVYISCFVFLPSYLKNNNFCNLFSLKSLNWITWN